ncbi:MAG: hypothetical protein KGH61_01675 [Candidatus Micrarchaeota archaeon]|nr:hypothetical protein [Candidatus Micrarchaeota archaeon]MDE1847639.1 hypothetical protein [Candidatus Micrarchaeota archaeon]MDE1864460.1 hypothetical protein [Candidatus Micrarchaeota archaeon]
MNIALRCYIDNKLHAQNDKVIHYNENLVLVFDTETTIDQYQNLKFGSYGIWQNDKLDEFGLFYDNNLDNSDVKTLSDYANKKHIKLVTKSQFLDMFIDYVYKRRAICVGFNLPFDISRIAIDYSISRKDNNAFSFKLFDNVYMPRIIIKHIDSKRSLINFSTPYSKNFKNYKRVNRYRGTFVDLRTLSFALTNENHSLESACELFNVGHKKLKTEEHGKITSEYIRYNINDVFASYDLFLALKSEFSRYKLPTLLNKLLSPASIGKEYFKEMGIKPFLELNPTFPKQMLGWIMTTYYGGRTEVHIRKTPVKVSYIDFTSMYPSQFVLLGLWDYVIADNIDVIEDNKFAELLENIQLDDLTNKDLWKTLNGIALVDVDNDILPLRAKYNGKIAYNIGLNYAKGKALWYTYPDIIASKLLTGKAPKIIKAFRFVPKGKQSNLNTINLFGKNIEPEKDDFIRYLIEHRLEVKQKLKQDTDNKGLKKEDFIAKIIANATSYGIFVEVNTQNERVNAEIYGISPFTCEASKKEQFGRAFNPILATMLTSGSRLILAMVEAYVKENKGYFAYCDTDALFVNPELVDKIQAFFKPLNPYSTSVEMFKVENDESGKPLHDVWFYGISAKRYCLYRMVDNKIDILKHSSHGLGGLIGISEDEIKQIWHDVLSYHYGTLSKEAIGSKYSNMFVMGKLALTSPFIMQRFRRTNRDKRLKPFNFVIVGIGYRLDSSTKEPIIPLLAYTKNTDIVPFSRFIDYKTGKEYTDNTKFYWKPLSEFLFAYANHNDNKYDGAIGELRRKQIVINDIEHIGKESNNIEESEVIGVSDSDYVVYDNKTEQKITDAIKNMTTKDAKRIGLSKRHLFRLKKRINEEKKIELKKKTMKKLMNVII